MWFKNIQLFKLKTHFALDPTDLDAQLHAKRKIDCPTHQQSNQGWMSPYGKHSDRLVVEQNKMYLLAFCDEEKIIPSSVIMEKTQDKIAALEQEECRKLSQKERKSIKETVFASLLPLAFSKTKVTQLILDVEEGWILVDCTSRNQAERCLDFLRSTLGSLPIKAIDCQHDVAFTLSNWLIDGILPNHLMLLNRCEMFDDKQARSTIKFTDHELHADHVVNHLKHGHKVGKVGIKWHEKLSFSITCDLECHGIKYHDMDEVKDCLDNQQILQKEAVVDTEFALIAPLYRQLIDNITTWFGGLSQSTSSTNQPIAAHES